MHWARAGRTASAWPRPHQWARPRRPSPGRRAWVLPVELAGGPLQVRREGRPRFAEAHDYVRLHTRPASHLVRIPLSRLEEHWAEVLSIPFVVVCLTQQYVTERSNT
ncbi:hypothetical protein HBB16_20680, partial [Pseudonocardia sp. MCCB 268]|nr:hypothetical protein [Pseudonocardia cytotoxica]